MKAYHHNLIYPQYVWIMYEDYLSPLDVHNGNHCTDEELASVLKGAIVLKVINSSNETTDNGIVSPYFDGQKENNWNISPQDAGLAN